MCVSSGAAEAPFFPVVHAVDDILVTARRLTMNLPGARLSCHECSLPPSSELPWSQWLLESS